MNIKSKNFIKLNQNLFNIQYSYNYTIYFYFVFSYPSHKQFDIIGRAIVLFLKLLPTKENIVSLFILFNDNLQLC